MSDFSIYLSLSRKLLNADIPLELNLEINQINGKYSHGKYLLLIPLKIRPSASDLPKLNILSCVGYLYFDKESFERSSRPWIGHLISISSPLQLPLVDSSSRFSFLFTLTKEDIENIEIKRNGQDFFLTLALDCVVYLDAEPSKGFDLAQASHYFNIPRSYWQDEILNKWNYLSHHFVLWSTPNILNEEFKKINEEYLKAEQCFRCSDCPGTLIAIRNTYDRLISIKRYKLGNKTASFETRLSLFQDNVLENSFGKTRADMVASLIKSQWRMLSAPTKPGSRHVNRSTASLALKVASLTVSYISEYFGSNI